MNDKNGRWVTINGNHVFIQGGHARDTSGGRYKVVDQSRVGVVKGPQNARKYIDEYIKKNPEIEREAQKYMDVLDDVKNFEKEHPGAPDGTYDAVTLKMVPPDKLPPYCVTFHQNYKADDPYSKWSKEDYARMCAIAKKELGSDSVYIGYYGNPEVSFSCDSLAKAQKFGIAHNQQSVYDSAADRTLINLHYDWNANPIKGKEPKKKK